MSGLAVELALLALAVLVIGGLWEEARRTDVTIALLLAGNNNDDEVEA